MKWGGVWGGQIVRNRSKARIPWVFEFLGDLAGGEGVGELLEIGLRICVVGVV